MAYNRPINNVECLPIVSVGDSLCDGSGEPIINKAFKTLNGLQNIGVGGVHLNGRIANGGTTKPFLGDSGPYINELASDSSDPSPFIYFPGYTHYEVVYRTRLAYRTTTATEQQIEISILIGGVPIVLDRVSPTGLGPSRAIGTSNQVVGYNGVLPTTLLPASGPTILSSITVTSTKTNPQTGISVSSFYWDGVFELQLRFYKNCGL